MRQLLEIMRCDRDFRDNVGRNGLPAVFGILNNEGALVEHYRSLMMSSVH